MHVCDLGELKPRSDLSHLLTVVWTFAFKSMDALQARWQEYGCTSSKMARVWMHFKQDGKSTDALQAKWQEYGCTSSKMARVRMHFKQDGKSTDALQARWQESYMWSEHAIE